MGFLTASTVIVQVRALASDSLLLACALLIVNNLRDIPSDEVAGKRTLAVILGDQRTRSLYVALVAVALLALFVVAAALSAIIWTMTGPSVTNSPESSASAGTWPFGLIFKKSSPFSSFLARRSTLTRS